MFRLIGGIVADQGQAAVQLRLDTLHQAIAGDFQHVDAEAAEFRLGGINEQQIAILDSGQHGFTDGGFHQHPVRLDAEYGPDPIVTQADELGAGRRNRRFKARGGGLRTLRQHDEIRAVDPWIKPRHGAPAAGGLADGLKSWFRPLAHGQPTDTHGGGLGESNQALPARLSLALEPLAKRGGGYTSRSGQAVGARPMPQDRVQAGDKSSAIRTDPTGGLSSFGSLPAT